MRRLWSLIACLVVLAAAAAPAAGDEHPPKLAAALVECLDGPAPQDRAAAFAGSMPADAGTRRMAMRFDLYERRRGGRWRRLRGVEGFGEWERSEAGRKGFVYTKRVDGLRERRWYHVKVRFRWYGADGRVRRTERLRSRSCRQPDQRPDLTAELRAAQPAPDGTRGRYFVAVENVGRTAADATILRLRAAGAVEERALARMGPGERRVIEVAGPRCAAGERVTIHVDPADRVDEARERNNRVSAPCPL